MTTEQHTAQEQPEGADSEQVIAQGHAPSRGIDPEKLLELARQRHHNGGVTLGWPTVIKIVEELRQGRTAVEERDRFSRLFANACETLGAVQEALGNEDAPATIGLEPELVRELKEGRDALAAHVERISSYKDRLEAKGLMPARLAGIIEEAPATSLARRDDEQQAEGALAVRHLTQGEDWEDQELREVIDDYVAGLRRQAMEATE